MSIDGVVLKELVTHVDERGFFREVIRESDEFFDHFGQWSHSLMYPGVAKAWHIHQRQTDWWYVIGALKVALYDTRADSPTRGQLMEFLMGDGKPGCLKIPPGVAHGCRALALTNLLDKLTYAGNLANLAELDGQPGYRFVHGDICDEKLVDSLAAETDAIVNFAAETHVDRSLMDPFAFVETDVRGTAVLCEAARK